MAYDGTRNAAGQLRDDVREHVDELRGDFQRYIGTLAERLGVARDDAKQLANDLTAYLQEWSKLVREDITKELKSTIINAALAVSAAFVGAIGFLLLNFGAIWSLSDAGADVGPWFLIFGGGWIILAAILGGIAFARQRKVTKETGDLLNEDLQLPRRHAATLMNEYQEAQNEQARAH